MLGNKLHFWTTLLTAHFLCAVHVLGLFAWAMHDFMQNSVPSLLQTQMERILAPMLWIFQFPGFQLLGSESDVPSITASVITGYLIGLRVTCFPSKSVVRPSFKSLIWWMAMIAIMTDVVTIFALVKEPSRFLITFFRLLVMLAPVTVIGGCGVLFGLRSRSRSNVQSGQSDDP